VRNRDFVFRTIVDEAVLVPIRRDVAEMDCIYTLNPVAAWIWQSLGEGATLPELESAVLQRFDAEPEAVAADVVRFVAELEAAGAVVRM
jgi:hypothetical protein